jgi:hypothetical protein
MFYAPPALCRECEDIYISLIKEIACTGCVKIVKDAFDAYSVCKNAAGPDCAAASKSIAARAATVETEAMDAAGGGGGTNTALILGIVAAVLMAVGCLGVGAFLAWQRWGKEKEGDAPRGLGVYEQRLPRLPSLRPEDIIATNHFGSVNLPDRSQNFPDSAPQGLFTVGNVSGRAVHGGAGDAPSVPPDPAPYEPGSSGPRHISPEPYVSTGTGIANGAEWLPPGSVPKIKIPLSRAESGFPGNAGPGLGGGNHHRVSAQTFSLLPQEHQSAAVLLASAPANHIRVTYTQVGSYCLPTVAIARHVLRGKHLTNVETARPLYSEVRDFSDPVFC